MDKQRKIIEGLKESRINEASFAITKGFTDKDYKGNTERFETLPEELKKLRKRIKDSESSLRHIDKMAKEFEDGKFRPEQEKDLIKEIRAIYDILADLDLWEMELIDYSAE